MKLLKFLSSWDDQSRHLQQKIERLKVLHDPRACTPLALEVSDEHQFIVQPWFAGQSLNTGSATTHRVANRFFYHRLYLSGYLQTVHDAGITHGGIKPHNILVQSGTLIVRLTDFITRWIFVMSVIYLMILSLCAAHWLILTRANGGINYRVDFSYRFIFVRHRVL